MLSTCPLELCVGSLLYLCMIWNLPIQVRYALGGVARNVAECMLKLGAKPYLISATGFDLAGLPSIYLQITTVT